MVRRSAIALAILVPIFAAGGQTQEPPPSGASPVIKVTTRQVQVSIVVHDKKGQPVEDLSKDDFVLYDKGQEQHITYFAKETSSPTGVPRGLATGVVSNRLVGD